MQDREKVWADFIAFAGSGDNRCQDRAGDIMARIFHQLPDQKKATQDVENLTMGQMDYVTREP